MVNRLSWLLSPLFILLLESSVLAQAGRYIPPRIPGGGSGINSPYLIPIHTGGKDSDTNWTIVGILFLAAIFWGLGKLLGNEDDQFARNTKSNWVPGALPQRTKSPPPMEDLILNRGEVAPKAQQTRRLLEFLAHRDRLFDPSALTKCISMTFLLVQECWQKRNYAPVADMLTPGILAKHEELLKSMRRNHEINRFEGLRIDRLELVHIYGPENPDHHEVTALITFQGTSYYIDDRSQEYRRGLQKPTWFQEFWTFRRHGETWRLHTIEQSHESDRLEAANVVAELTEEQLQNGQASIAL
jgi:hypothetical protein